MKADAGVTSLHGWEIAKLQLGVEYRYDRGIAISPVVGADHHFFHGSNAYFQWLRED